MPYTVVRYESTPNPNAMKCWLDRPISDRPRSFLNASMAASDPLARDLFERAGLTTLLLNGDWMTINKAPEAQWKSVRKRVEEVLAKAASDPDLPPPAMADGTGGAA